MPHRDNKIQSQAGISLSDIYDVIGSQVGIKELIPDDVRLFHEMGSTVFAERMGGGILRFSPGAIAQNLDFQVESGQGNFPEVPTRILGVQVVHDQAAGRILRVQCSVNAPNGGGTGVARDFPIWVWNSTDDIEQTLRLTDAAGNVSTGEILIPTNPTTQLPSFLFGTSQPSVPVPQIVLRGTTSAFGAGTVSPTVLVYISNAQTVRPSSYGLPIPSW